MVTVGAPTQVPSPLSDGEQAPDHLTLRRAVEGPTDQVHERASVLLVEDDPGDERLTRATLAQSDVEAELTVARSLAAAIASLQTAQFDVVILDLGLPDSVGVGGVAAVREARPGVPIIVLTGHDDPDTTGVEALRLGAQDFLVKGVASASEFGRAIRYAIERDRLLRSEGARRVERAALAQIGAAASTASTPEEFVRTVAGVAAAALDAPFVEVEASTPSGVLFRAEVEGPGRAGGARAHDVTARSAAAEDPAGVDVRVSVRRSAPFDDDELDFTRAVARLASGALEQADTAARLDARTRQLRVAHGVAQQIQRGTDGPTVVRSVAELLLDTVGSPDRVRVEVRCGDLSAAVGDDAVQADTPIAFPIVVEGRRVGEIRVLSQGSSEWPAEELSFVEGVADQLATWHALRTSHEEQLVGVRRLEQLMDTARVALFLVEGDGTVPLVNRAAKQLLGIEPGGVSPWSVRSGDDSPLAGLFERGEAISGAVHTVISPGGDRVAVSIDAATLATGDTVSASAVVAVTDVSAERRRHDALESALDRERRSIEELRRLDDQRELFLRAVSHELRTPASVVIGYAETLLEHDRELEAGQRDKMLDRIAVHGRRLGRLLEDLLDLGRMTTQTSPHVVLAAQDVAAVVDHVIEGLDVGDRTLRTTLEPAVAMIDTVRFERIVVNLLSNAARHTPDGSSIWVHVGVDPASGEAVLVVEDDGPGVHQDVRARVFDVFVQGPSTAGEAKPGTGIGLSLVREFAKLQQAEVSVGERDGGGARFEVRFPPVS